MTSSRRMDFFIGMMVIGIIAGVFVMTILFGSDRGFFVGNTGGKRLTIVFEKGGGISQNSLVLKNGIKIGRVYSVELEDDETDSSVRVSFELEPNYKIYSNEYAKINRTLLGDASIEFVDDPDYTGEIYEVTDGSLPIPGRNTGDLMGTVSNIEGDLAQALQNINEASKGVTLFMENINTIMGDESELQLKKERLQSVFTELESALTSIRNLATNMNVVVSDEDIVGNIRSATAEAPEILRKVSDLTDGAKKFMTDANSMSNDVRKTLARAETTFDLVDKNLDNVNVFTTSLADNGPKMMTALNESSVEIKSTIFNIRDAVDNISTLAANLNEKLDDPNSPIGLLNDAETAKSLRHIVKNAEELSQKLYPILDDARVFSNKVAHRPSSLIWDKTTFKGSSAKGQYGYQSGSPTGGISSPLYRQTPNGASIRERNYYQPAADEEFMDPATRDYYNGTLAAARPERTGLAGRMTERMDLRPSAKTERTKWSLASFWRMLGFGRNSEEAYDGHDPYGEYDEGEYYAGAYPSEAYASGYGAALAGYETDGTGYAGLEQPVYEYGGEDYGFGSEFADTYSGTFDDGADAGWTNQGAQSYGGERGYGAPEPAGAYYGGQNAPMGFNDADATGAEEIEALPSSINRPVRTSVAAGSFSGGFEDDGLPLEFVPPAE